MSRKAAKPIRDRRDDIRAPWSSAEILQRNRTRRDYPLDRPVIAYFEQQAREAPRRLAVQFEAQSLTYGELNRRANRVARVLIARGVKPDDFVGVCMQRSPELVVALLAIVKASAAYVPFDPEYPRDRLDYMFADSGVRLVLTHEAVADIAFPAGLALLKVDNPELVATGAEDDASPAFAGGPDTAVYMIYTSGSTGKPKGVPNIHRGLANRLLWMQETFQLGPEDRVLQKTPFSFNVSVWEFFWPLMVGAGICVAKPGGHRDNRYLVELIAAAGVTTLHFVPSMLGLFLGAEGLERLSRLKRVMCSGEALPYELTRRFFERLPGKELHNLYGPTEASIDVTWWPCRPDDGLNVIPIGFPIANTQTYILDEQLRPVAAGEAGELHLGGVQLARGYWNRPELTREKFIRDPFSRQPDARLYKTGDLARYLPTGAIEYLGRLDFQVKLRGFRIELGEIEAVLLKQPGIREAVVTAAGSGLAEKQLVTYLVAAGERPSASALKQGLLRELPEYMVPARFMYLQAMPLSPNGKIDRQALPEIVNQRPELAEMFVAPQTPLQRDLCAVWKQILDLDRVGVRDNFFDLGGNSLQVLSLVTALSSKLGREIPAVKVFQFPSVEKLAAHLSDAAADPLLNDAYQRMIRARGELGDKRLSGAVAVVGMVGRFPGAANLGSLWSNLINDVEAISRFTPQEIASGVDEETRSDPNYIPCRGIIEDADKFDNAFFGIGPQEAKVMDPQQRVFLEMAWHALEEAGYDPSRFPGMIGVYAGVGDNHYYYNNVLCHPDVVKTVGKLIVGYGNEKDYIATRVSYQLDLTGPSVSATTGCSTSLLSIDNACKALNAFECDMALAGGVDIMVPQKSGQVHQEGGPFTRDGHCRPFDADASGTMFCDGAAIVVLRRLEEAVAAGDHIYAVVLGSAKNNDGAGKVSFLAPSVEGQARVIALAQAQANVQADSIGYVEAHGTGTPLGDPIELEALTKAFRATTDRERFCKIGSIKGHIGHPTIASGIAGFIKVALSLHHQEIPGTLHFKAPNPRFDLAHSPFEILARRTPWPKGAQPRRGAVSSFGFGGTNVHAILEEAPPVLPSGPGRGQQLLLLSAKTPAALERLRRQFAVHLGARAGINLADVAYTLQVGRKQLAYRDYVVAADVGDAVAQLATPRQSPQALHTIDPAVVFLFPGQGAQYINMGRELYAHEPQFRTWLDRCCDLFRPHLDRDLRELLFPKEAQQEEATRLLKDTGYTQPAMFAIELSLARWWMSLGIKPAAVIGHSIGEFVGACLGGVFTLEDATALVALRARLIRDLPTGTMLSVRAAAADLEVSLPPALQLAAVNGPSLCVVAGPHQAIADYARQLQEQGIQAKPLQTSHAFHSAMMDPIIGTFRDAVAKVRINAPDIPFLSTSLGAWVSRADELGAEYWAQHIRRPVQFAGAIATALADLDPATVFLEVGPRDVLTTLTRMQVQGERRSRSIASLGEAAEPARDAAALTAALGRLWMCGVTVDWEAYRGVQQRRRVPLPTYAFERRSHWLEPLRLQGSAVTTPALTDTVARPAGPPQPERTQRSATPEGRAPVRGLRLGRDPRGLATWYVPDARRPDLYRPLDGGNAPAEPFAPPMRKVLPATAAQRDMYRIAREGGDAALGLHEAFAIRLVGPLDEGALAAAIQGLARIHEAVRGHFSGDGLEFVVEPVVTVPVVERELGRVSESELAAAQACMETLEATRHFDLDSGPLIRMALLRAGDESRVLILTAHAAACDGWSLDVLLEDLGRLYCSFSAQEPPARLPLHGFSDYIKRRSAVEFTAAAERARDYWRRQLAVPAPPLMLPYDQPRPAARTYAARAAVHTVAAGAMHAIHAFGRSSGVSFFAVLFAGFVRQLARLSGATDLVIGVSFAGHPASGMEDAVGRLVSVLPVRVRAPEDEPFAELCRRCHVAILDASDQTVLGVEELPDAGLLAATFTYVREYNPGELRFGAATVSYQAVPRRGLQAELAMTITEAHDRLVLGVLGNAGLASQHWLQGLVQELGALLTDACIAREAAAPARGGNAAPKDALEQYLVDLWIRTLGVTEVSVDSSFYELGGHSLLAVQVFNDLHHKFKVSLPLSALVEHGTVRSLASHLRSVADLSAYASAVAPTVKTPAWNTVVALQTNGDLPPFYCAAGLGGNPMNLRHLSLALGDRQPFYALQHRGVDGVLKPHDTIAALAAESVADIRKMQPRGPYYLGGYSFGGLVAYEMAQLLLRDGETVAGLVLLDSANPSSLKWSPWNRVLQHLRNLLADGPRYLRDRITGNLERRRQARERKRRAVTAAQGAFDHRIDLVIEMSNAAEACYVPQPLDAEVVLIKTDFRIPTVDGIGYAPHESNGWRGLVPAQKLQILSVKCSHLDMVQEKYAAATGVQVTAGLAALRAKMQSP